MKIPILAAQNKQRSRQFDMPALHLWKFFAKLFYSIFKTVIVLRSVYELFAP
jgi:hypothetical protein